MSLWLKIVLGAFAGVFLLVLLAINVATYFWNRRVDLRLASMRSLVSPSARGPFSYAELGSLPEPVQRYFRYALREGQPMILEASFAQEGEFLTDEKKGTWSPFTAMDYFTAYPAGFVWDAKIRMMPGIPVRVFDNYVADTAGMRGSIGALITMVNSPGGRGLDEGALYRYLAETPWFPTRLLPGNGISWTPIDDSSARVTLTDGPTTVSMIFEFNEKGQVMHAYTNERPRDHEGKVRAPWGGYFSDYREIDGMMVPTSAVVEWNTPDGPAQYWRGRCTSAEYRFAGE